MLKEVVSGVFGEEGLELVGLVLGAGGIVIVYTAAEDNLCLKSVFMPESVENILTEIDVETEGVKDGFVLAARPLKWKGENTLETEVMSMPLNRYRKGGKKELYEFLKRHFEKVVGSGEAED